MACQETVTSTLGQRHDLAEKSLPLPLAFQEPHIALGMGHTVRMKEHLKRLPRLYGPGVPSWDQ